jgi:predicted kinase
MSQINEADDMVKLVIVLKQRARRGDRFICDTTRRQWVEHLDFDKYYILYSFYVVFCDNKDVCNARNSAVEPCWSKGWLA